MNSGPIRGRALRVAACLVLPAALTGCMQLNLGLTVSADDTVNGQLLLTAQKTVLTSGNRTVEAGFAELRQNIPALPAGEETRYEDGKLFGSQITYRNVPLRDFNSESVRLVREDGLYRFTLPLDPKKYGGKVAEQNPQNQQAFMRLMSFEISVTFPGRVLDTNGTVNGRSVSWQVGSNQEKPTELRALAEAPPRPSASAAASRDDGSGFPWLLVAGAAALLLLVAAVAVLLLRRRRTAPVAGGPVVPGQATGPATAPDATTGNPTAAGPSGPA
ncbi:LppM family (lipo)protein [Micromonospora sp. NPDC047670]|uniref:LppM family (lipo)protein n=1 Tax=Micromonospora sp. NPDC047670 TaxID=3364252 RepID=UPI00371C9362